MKYETRFVTLCAAALVLTLTGCGGGGGGGGSNIVRDDMVDNGDMIGELGFGPLSPTNPAWSSTDSLEYIQWGVWSDISPAQRMSDDAFGSWLHIDQVAPVSALPVSNGMVSYTGRHSFVKQHAHGSEERVEGRAYLVVSIAAEQLFLNVQLTRGVPPTASAGGFAIGTVTGSVPVTPQWEARDEYIQIVTDTGVSTPSGGGIVRGVFAGPRAEELAIVYEHEHLGTITRGAIGSEKGLRP